MKRFEKKEKIEKERKAEIEKKKFCEYLNAFS